VPSVRTAEETPGPKYIKTVCSTPEQTVLAVTLPVWLLCPTICTLKLVEIVVE
jgi:hypothetical protein